MLRHIRPHKLRVHRHLAELNARALREPLNPKRGSVGGTGLGALPDSGG